MTSLREILTATAVCLPLFLLSQVSIAGDWQSTIPMEDGSTLPFLVSISEDGSYIVDFAIDGTADVKGKMEMEGEDMISMVDLETDAFECKDVKGFYRFKQEKHTLILERVEDPCPGRGGPGKMEFTRRK